MIWLIGIISSLEAYSCVDVSHYYITANTKIDPIKSTVSKNDIAVSVRPKTMQLLLLLIEANAELVSKEVILATIWDDVLVDDQVVFQSIKEIRKLFGNSDVIRNVPRKGYAWAEAVERIDEPSKVKSKRWLDFPNAKVWAGFTLIALLVLGIVFISPKPSSNEALAGSIVVLPFHNTVQGSDHKWVRVGAMDQLIQGLYSTNEAAVLQTDYVFDVMSRANMPMSHYDSSHIRQVFQVSGANLIIEGTLTGATSDYQLLYTLYYRNSLEKGSISSPDVDSAIAQLTAIVGKRLDPDFVVDSQQYTNLLANELLVSAIEHKQLGENDQAISLMEAVVTTEPTNILALRLLGQTLIENNRELLRAEQLLGQGIKLAQSASDKRELVRLYFWQSVGLLQQGNITDAVLRLEKVDQIAHAINDWLYLAYAQEVKGRVFQYERDFDSANTAFTKAMNYHEVLQCPLGYSNGLMNLSELAYSQNQIDIAKAYASDALDVVERRELNLKKPHVKAWLEKLQALSR